MNSQNPTAMTIMKPLVAGTGATSCENSVNEVEILLLNRRAVAGVGSKNLLLPGAKSAVRSTTAASSCAAKAAAKPTRNLRRVRASSHGVTSAMANSDRKLQVSNRRRKLAAVPRAKAAGAALIIVNGQPTEMDDRADVDRAVTQFGNLRIERIGGRRTHHEQAVEQFVDHAGIAYQQFGEEGAR